MEGLKGPGMVTKEERRQFVRVNRNVPVDLEIASQGLEGKTEARDISEGGLRLSTQQVKRDLLRQLFAERENFKLKLNLPAEIGTVESAVHIVWIKEESSLDNQVCFGVKFIEAEVENLNRIRRYISFEKEKKTRIEFIPRYKENDYSADAVSRRRQWLSEKTNTKLHHLGHFSLPAEEMRGNIENLIGTAQIPIGVAGPLRINGEYAKGDFYVPMATTEGVLVATYQRGMLVITKAGGANVIIYKDENHISPVFLLKDLKQGKEFINWIKTNFPKVKEAAESTTKYGKLMSIAPYPVGRRVILNFSYFTGDAMGSNMINVATEAACEFIIRESSAQKYLLRSNLSSEKKASFFNLIVGFGKGVSADILIPKEIVKKYLNSSAEEMCKAWYLCVLGGFQAGIIGGINAHYANGLAAIFTACGQDIAHIVNASIGTTILETTETGDLYIAVKLPSIIVGTIGGGTALGTQRECLEMLGCYGQNKSKKFAEIVTATLLAGELAISSAIASGKFLIPHKRARKFVKERIG